VNGVLTADEICGERAANQKSEAQAGRFFAILDLS
jgi:hypothetical protein